MNGTHACPGGCGRQVPNRHLACGPHWNLVPPALQWQVYHTYQRRLAYPADRAARMAHERAKDAAVDAMRKALER